MGDIMDYVRSYAVPRINLSTLSIHYHALLLNCEMMNLQSHPLDINAKMKDLFPCLRKNIILTTPCRKDAPSLVRIDPGVYEWLTEPHTPGKFSTI